MNSELQKAKEELIDYNTEAEDIDDSEVLSEWFDTSYGTWWEILVQSPNDRKKLIEELEKVLAEIKSWRD